MMVVVIPFLDLAAPHRDLREELLSVFEGDFAAFCDSQSCVVPVGIASEVLSRPMFPELLPEQQRAVAKAIQSYTR